MSDAEIASTAAETVTAEPTTTEEKMEQEPVVEKTEKKEEEEKEKTNDDKKAESEESTEMETTEAEEPAKDAPSKKGGKKPAAAAPAPSARGRKRKAGTPTPASPEKSKKEKSAAPKTPATNKRSRVTPVKLTWQQFCNQTPGDRVLSCGEGEQLGHPGRTTTKKPRKVDIVEEDELKIVQVVAGGVHSAMLTVDGDVYACGINEKGTVPAKGVEAEGSTDEFTQIEFSDDIKKCGKMVMLTAGASFTAALTDKGDVIAWGNLRDSNGEVNVHPLLAAMKLQPTVIVQHKYFTIVKIAAGENHLAMLTDGGQLLTFGEGSMGQLGRSNRTSTIRANRMVDETGKHLLVTVRDPAARGKNVHFKDVHAAGFWTMAVADDGRVFSFGLNNFSHLGVEMDGQDEEAEEHAGEEEQQAAAKGEADDRELRVMLPKHAARLDGHPWTHLQGVQHVIARADNGDVYAIGKNTDNALGLGTWSGNDDTEHWRYTHLEKMDTLSSVAGVTAKLGSSIAWREDGTALAWGCDTSGQLGLGIKDDDDKVVPKPEQIESAHLNGFKIVSASMADNHTLFLVVKE